MTEQNYRLAVIESLMGALAVQEGTDGDLPEGSLGAAFEYSQALPADLDPETGRALAEVLASFTAGYQAHMERVAGYINFLFCDLVREVQVLNPDFDATEFLRRHALAAAGDGPEAWQQG